MLVQPQSTIGEDLRGRPPIEFYAEAIFSTVGNASNTKFIVCEDKEYKLLFESALAQLGADDVLVYAADYIGSPRDSDNNPIAMGASDRVREVCHIHDQQSQSTIVLAGICDRECQNFEHNQNVLPTHDAPAFQTGTIQQYPILDRIPNQIQIGCLVQSRGHSVENYFFEPLLLSSGLISMAIDPTAGRDAYKLFEGNFNSIIQCACVIGLTTVDLTGSGVSKWEQIRQYLFEHLVKHVQFTNNGFQFDINSWVNDAFNQTMIRRNYANRFNEWMKSIQLSNLDISRWLCHGHLGDVFIYKAYESALKHVYLVNSQKYSHAKQKIDAIDPYARFRLYANPWLAQNVADRSKWSGTPLECLTMIGL